METDGFTDKPFSAIEDKTNFALFDEDFQVEDLLDLRGLSEPEVDDEKEEITARGLDVSAFDKEASFQLSEIILPFLQEETIAADLEWLSHFIDDCNSEYPACNFPMRQAPLFTSAYKNHNRRKRSKRHRRRSGGIWSVSGTSPVSSVTTSAISSSSPSCSCSSSPSYMFSDPFPPLSNIHMPKKRGRKPKISAAGGGHSSAERRCAHCGSQKTPQWRTGPNGPKTLCNACGVRFKSGRLLPEYRPACSPTFVGTVHSNSHRKVLEMRRKKEGQLFSVSAPTLQSC